MSQAPGETAPKIDFDHPTERLRALKLNKTSIQMLLDLLPGDETVDAEMRNRAHATRFIEGWQEAAASSHRSFLTSEAAGQYVHNFGLTPDPMVARTILFATSVCIDPDVSFSESGYEITRHITPPASPPTILQPDYLPTEHGLIVVRSNLEDESRTLTYELTEFIVNNTITV
jgi:hypothetical protein